MLPLIHFIGTTALAAALYPWYGLNILWVYLGGFFIDADHYMWFVMKFRDFSLKKAYDYCKNDSRLIIDNPLWKNIFIFHTLEFLIFMTILSFYYKPAFIITIGIILHLIMDWIEEIPRKGVMKSPFLIVCVVMKLKKRDDISA